MMPLSSLLTGMFKQDGEENVHDDEEAMEQLDEAGDTAGERQMEQYLNGWERGATRALERFQNRFRGVEYQEPEVDDPNVVDAEFEVVEEEPDLDEMDRPALLREAKKLEIMGTRTMRVPELKKAITKKRKKLARTG